MDYPHDFGLQQHQQQVDFAGNVVSAPSGIHQQQPRYHHDFDSSSAAMQEHSQTSYATAAQKISCDVKPRLTKEQHDVLEAHYQKQQKPNTSTKRGFAEALNVSLEKVNNWFQNRRAKSKQDAKKQLCPAGMFSVSQQSSLNMGASDSDTSPAFASQEYLNMMPDDDDYLLAYEQPQPQPVTTTDPQLMTATNELSYFPGVPPQELNRRTLTQEQFDAFAQQDMMINSGDLAMLTDPQAFNKFIALESSMAEETPAELAFSFSNVQQHAISAPTSEWSDSRSTSASLPQSFENHNISPQWQPGSSVPVDFDQLSQEFKQVAQARQMPLESPNPWAAEGDMRGDSSTSHITQSMGNVGLDTPQLQQGPFKSPGSPVSSVSSLAARRQRQRPPPLGLASLRSQSYHGTSQATDSPGAMHPPSGTPPQLRRIKSSNVVGVAQGRIQKNIAAPQRSPLNWTFADAVTSPQAIRHGSSHSGSSLAPPTPLSPPDNTAELMKAHQQWQNASKLVNRPASIFETETEHTFAPPQQHFSSPPQTPMYYPHQQFLPPQIIPGNMIMENTPPQSAPASQQCFPQNIYGHSPQHMFQPPVVYQQPVFMPQPQHAHQVVGMFEQEQMQMSMPPQFTVTTTAPSVEMPMHFAQNGLPIVDAQGQIALAMPSQLQFVQHKIHRSDSKQGFPAGSQTTFSAMPETMQVTAQIPKNAAHPSSDFFVHEYTPPQDIKRTITPRKPVDTGPKNYTFANQTPEHFEKSKKGEKSSGSNSPDSASSA